VLVTPAKNEEAQIEATIRSVGRQTVLPARWVVVSDGSTDLTDAIVKEFCRANKWMDLVRVPGDIERQFAAKVHAFKAGYAALSDTKYDVIGNLDADITFCEDYFEFLLERFQEDPRLGVAGTPFDENGQRYDYNFTNIEHVSGACQLFRRECFEAIGGFVPIRGGGEDWAAVTTARMKGWVTRTFPERVCYHHRKMGAGEAGASRAWFRRGRRDYCLGWHPLWELFRAIYQMKYRPFILGGLLLLLGYASGWMAGIQRPVSRELVSFHRKEQMRRLKDLFIKAA